MKNFTLYTPILIITLLVSCSQVSSQQNLPEPVSQQWKDYWYAGEAELSRYQLEQARYGEIHEGEAVLIFVTEDFLEDKQVKYERGSKENAVSVLKLNATKKFWTGIYPYSLMTSVFSPVDGSPTLKVSTTAQEWCGHAYSQLNYRNTKYEGMLHSYFQSEADQQFTLKDTWLEDELWNIIRTRPDQLPTGTINIVPSTQYLRLKHRPFQAERATTSLEEIKDADLSESPLLKFEVRFKGFDRVLTIFFDQDFPHQIKYWEEVTNAGFGQEGTLTTKATLTHSIKSPYWGKNAVADSTLRQKLGLKYR